MISVVITTSDNLTHGPIALLPDGRTPDMASYSSSPNTQAALAAAYQAGNWAEYIEPEPVELPPEVNPAAFRAALAQTPSWFTWAETLPSVHYTNLTIAAANNNWGEAQAIYNAIKGASDPPPAAVAAWQQQADANGIPITF